MTKDCGWDCEEDLLNVPSPIEQGIADGYAEGHRQGSIDGFDEGYQAGLAEGHGFGQRLAHSLFLPLLHIIRTCRASDAASLDLHHFYRQACGLLHEITEDSTGVSFHNQEDPEKETRLAVFESRIKQLHANFALKAKAKGKEKGKGKTGSTGTTSFETSTAGSRNDRLAF